jgi:uncharacterized pyridoxamine 5'-phosphate oxidase family protein
MHESADEIKEFNKMVGISARNASPQLKWELGLPEKKLTGSQILRHFQGVHKFMLSVSTSSGTPQISLVTALLYRGKFYIPTVRTALRSRYIQHEPRVSLARHKEDEVTLIANGRTSILVPDAEDEQEREEYRIVEEIHRMYSSEVPSDWKNGCYIRVEPFTLCASATNPRSYPSFAERKKTEAQTG